MLSLPYIRCKSILLSFVWFFGFAHVLRTCSLYLSWLSVLAVLSVDFARTIALALTISGFLDKLMTRVFTPILKRATPKEYIVRAN